MNEALLQQLEHDPKLKETILELFEKQHQEIETQHQEIKYLQEEVAYLRQLVFGRKSEKIKAAAIDGFIQPSLPFEDEEINHAILEEAKKEETELIVVNKHSIKRGRKPLPNNLP